MTALQQGLFDTAQRLFEVFVAAAPDHPSAPEARRHLGELYQRNGTPPAGPAMTGSVPAKSATVAAPPDPQTSQAIARRVASARPVAGPVEDRFMLEAGDRVFFSAGSAELGGRARAVLAAQARWLKRNATLSAVIEGHADDAPLGEPDLERLSAERAQAVFERLVEEGVPANRLAIAPMGPSRPVAHCSSPDCGAQNRRAVTVLTPQRLSELPALDRTGALRTR
jgi:peptidoglycan-associated lipoprotein